MEMIASVTDTYLSFFLSRPVWEVWTLFLLGLGRIIPIVALAPFLGGKILPDPVKMGLGVALVPIFLPLLIVDSTIPLHLDIHLMALLIKEIFIGSIMGFLISIPFYIAQGAGTLIDHQSGSQSLQVQDPSMQMQTTPTGVLYNNMMIVSFFAIGGPLLFFDALFTSYKVFPADQFINAAFFTSHTPFWNTILKLITTAVTITLQLSAPSIIAMLLSDLFLGIVNRMAPQVQISFLLWSVKSYAGVLLLWLGWWVILKQLDLEGHVWIKAIEDLLKHAKTL